MTEQRKWPDNWEWVDKEERTPATEAEAAAMVAKIEDRLRKTEAAAEEFKRGPTNDEPDFDQIFEEVQRRYDRDGSKPPMQHCVEATRDISWFKPEPNQTTLLLNELASTVGGFNAKYSIVKRYFAEALAVPDDVEKAARWIFDKSGDWTDLAKANAQKLAEYALRGKQ